MEKTTSNNISMRQPAGTNPVLRIVDKDTTSSTATAPLAVSPYKISVQLLSSLLRCWNYQEAPSIVNSVRNQVL